MLFSLDRFPLLLKRNRSLETDRKRQRRENRDSSTITTSSATPSYSSLAWNDDTESVVVASSQNKSFQDGDWWLKACCGNVEIACKCCKDHSQQSKNPVNFRNCGLELWNTSRIAWRQSLSVEETRTTHSQPLRRRDREQVQILLRTRTGPHPLPQVIALSEMVQMYNFLWNEDDSDA
ncbi:hypothetical protein FisN_9Lh001 [Fistulifera solaris]|uniref:Uncharacterized protein n=1 Tax=Fistulifera solaris TaxID=1519565 RepID=A0A1Z5KHL3_FISSO|nr:hypothetical protein FisN_9Lh001 [Fistulifera solaris]|eukprot:GAX25803.1 hypothetical protein FisN_9Lh001 [Fistulifera solaris]